MGLEIPDRTDQALSNNPFPSDRALLPLYTDMLQLWHPSHQETRSHQGIMAYVETRAFLQSVGRQRLRPCAVRLAFGCWLLLAAALVGHNH